MTARPRVVATDCDGTLLRTDGTVSSYTREVLSRITEAGIVVVLVTARPPRWLDDLSDLGVSGTALCGNGAFVYDMSRRTVVGHRLMEPPLVGELLHDLRDRLPGARLATESVNGLGREPEFPSAEDDHRYVGDLTGLAEEPAGKILVHHPGWDTEEISRRAAEVVGDRAEVRHSGAVRLGEISPRGVTKASALRDFCAALTPSVRLEEVWAFGDMPNDLPMLAAVGRGFAVANAHSDLRSVADEIVPGHEEDGVARTLARLLRGSG